MMLGMKNEPVVSFPQSADDERELHQRVEALRAHPVHQAHLSVLNEAIAGDGFDRSSSSSAAAHNGDGAAASLARSSPEGAQLYSPERFRMHADPQLYSIYASHHNGVDRSQEKITRDSQSMIDGVKALRPLVPDEMQMRNEVHDAIFNQLRQRINHSYLPGLSNPAMLADLSLFAQQQQHALHQHQLQQHQIGDNGDGSSPGAVSSAAGTAPLYSPNGYLDPTQSPPSQSAASPLAAAASSGALANALNAAGYLSGTLAGAGGSGTLGSLSGALGAGAASTSSSAAAAARQLRDASVASSGSDNQPPSSLIGSPSPHAASAYDPLSQASTNPYAAQFGGMQPSTSSAAATAAYLAGGAAAAGFAGYGLPSYGAAGAIGSLGGLGAAGSLYNPAIGLPHAATSGVPGLSGAPLTGSLSSHHHHHHHHSSGLPRSAPSHSSSSSSGSTNGTGSGSATKRTKRASDAKKKGSPRKKRGTLPKEAVKLLRTWLFQHFENPYPTDEQKNALAMETGLAVTQVNYWFINARVRIWRPALESVNGGKGHASKIRSGKPKSHANKVYLQTAAALALKNAKWTP